MFGFAPGAAVVGVRGERAEVVAVDVEGLGALAAEVLDERLREGCFSMAGVGR